MAENEELTMIKGLIVPTEWDRKGNVTGIALSGRDEIEYLIDKDRVGKRLLALIREEVEVRGLVREENNRKSIAIKTYRRRRAAKPGLGGPDAVSQLGG